MALGCVDLGLRRRARSLPSGYQLAGHVAFTRCLSLMAWPRLTGHMQSSFRTPSQAGEAPGRVPGLFHSTPNPCLEGFGRGPGAGLIRGVVCCCEAVRMESPARRAGISGPKRRGSPFISTHSFPRHSGWPTHLPSLGLHITWPGAARGFADYPPSAGLTALPTMFRALGALTFWQVALERMLGANSRSGSIGSARYRPSGPVLSVPADQKFPDHEISVWTDKAPNCYFEISGYNQQRFLGELSLVQTTAGSRGLQSSSRPKILQPFSLKSSWTSPLPRPCI